MDGLLFGGHTLGRLQGFDKVEANRLTRWLQTSRRQDAQLTKAQLQLSLASLSLPRDGRQKQIDLSLQGLLADPVEQLLSLGCPQENFHALGRQALEEFIDIRLPVGHHRGFDASGDALTSLEWRG